MRIASADLRLGTTSEFGDFNVFVGGNGVGKTTYLCELFAYASQSKRRRWFWVSKVHFTTSSLSDDMRLLASSMARKYEGNTLFYFSRAAKDWSGSTNLNNDLRFGQAEVDNLTTQDNAQIFEQTKYRLPFVSFASCDARLGLQDNVELTALNQPPQDPINVLYRHPSILSQIDKTIQERFGFNFVLLDHTRRNLYLGISREKAPVFDNQTTDVQLEFEKIDKWREENLTPISESGHGVRSMIRLLTLLFEPVNQVILIDEPEIHLYPSQKWWLGQQMIELAYRQGKQVFLVTHDPMILQGILDSGKETRVYRIDRDESHAGTVREASLSELVAGVPTRNQEQYLQGLFYQRCVVVEGASDRAFYQEMINEFDEVSDKDIGFVAAGGKAAAKHMAILARRVGIPCAFILDLDVLFQEPTVLRELFREVGGSGDPLEQLEKTFALEKEVSAAAEGQYRKVVKMVTGYTERYGFSNEWESQNERVLRETLISLQSVGIFVVPNGTLESWAPEVEPKVRFAELAPQNIRDSEELRTRLNSYLESVLLFLDIHIKAEC